MNTAWDYAESEYELRDMLQEEVNTLPKDHALSGIRTDVRPNWSIGLDSTAVYRERGRTCTFSSRAPATDFSTMCTSLPRTRFCARSASQNE